MHFTLPIGVRMNFTTWDGSGRVIHPNVIYFPDKLNNTLLWKYYHVNTPYDDTRGPGEDEESICVYVSEDEINVTENGIINPITNKPYPLTGDPCILFHPPTRKFYIYHITSALHHGGYNYERMESTDGITWTNRTPINKRGSVPSIIWDRDEHVFKMYHVSSTGRYPERGLFYSESKDGLNWTDDIQCVYPTHEHRWPSHMSIHKLSTSKLYWALSTYKNELSDVSDVYFLKSEDGINFESHRDPVLKRAGVYYKFYKPEFMIYHGILKCWYSAYGRSSMLRPRILRYLLGKLYIFATGPHTYYTQKDISSIVGYDEVTDNVYGSVE